MKQKTIRNITLSGILLALGLVLPFITGMQLGGMLCPMHIPVLICGFVCGCKYGLLIGILCPLLRSLLFGMPSLYPSALSMCAELGMYGLISGLLYGKLKKANVNEIIVIYISLILSQLLGRLSWGLIRFIIGTIDQTNVFTFKAFISGAFIVAWPGIVIQLIIIPIIVRTLSKIGYLE